MELMLEKTVLPVGVLQVPWQAMVHEAKRVCTGGDCVHLAGFGELRDPTETSVHSWMSSALQALWRHVVVCDACKHVLKLFLAFLRSEVPKGVQTLWPLKDAHKLDIVTPNGGKKRVAPDSYKKMAVHGYLQNKKARNGKGFVALDGYSRSTMQDWTKEAVVTYLKACRRCAPASPPSVLGLWTDCCRMGNPAREWQVSFAYDADQHLGFCLPPMATLCFL